MLQNVWDFFQDEILGMKWLNRLIGSGLEAAGLDTGGKVGGSIQFFIYDVVKIMVLLGFLILMISYIQSYFPPERTKKILGRFKGIGANIIAALLGTVTPFCSCSSIPLFIGFTSAGLPLGVTFSFLISSPMVDLGSLVLLMSIFGWKVAIVYVIVGLVIAVVGGTIIEKLHLENQVHEFIRNGHAMDAPQEELTKKDRLKFAWDQVVETAKKVAPYVLVGVGIGAFIHNWIPEDIIVKVLGTGNPFDIAPRYIASIENSGQHPSLQILYELVTLLDVSVDQFFFPEREQEKSTQRRQLDTMLNNISEKDLKILFATAKGIEEANNEAGE